MSDRKPRCKFGNDTCDGINGTSGFICRDCAEDAEFDAQEPLTGTDNLRPNPYELTPTPVEAPAPAQPIAPNRDSNWLNELPTEPTTVVHVPTIGEIAAKHFPVDLYAGNTMAWTEQKGAQESCAEAIREYVEVLREQSQAEATRTRTDVWPWSSQAAQITQQEEDTACLSSASSAMNASAASSGVLDYAQDASEELEDPRTREQRANRKFVKVKPQAAPGEQGG